MKYNGGLNGGVAKVVDRWSKDWMYFEVRAKDKLAGKPDCCRSKREEDKDSLCELTSQVPLNPQTPTLGCALGSFE